MGRCGRAVVVLGIAIGSLLLPSCNEPEPEATGPSPAVQAARSFFDSLHATNWQACAEQLHPDALAEFQRVLGPRLMAGAAGQAGLEQQILGMFDGVDSWDALRMLPPERFFVDVMGGLDRARPQQFEMLRLSTTDLVGEVAEGQDLVHVVYRLSGTITGPAGEIRFEEVEVLGLKRYDERWRPMLSAELKTLAQRFR